MVKCLAKRLIFSRSSGIGDASLITVWSEVRILPGPPPSPTVPVVSWRRANSAETAGFARWKLVSGPVLDGETPVCAALSLLGKFRFPAAFECPTGDWFESYEPSSLRCLRDGFDMTGCLARSSSPLGSNTHSGASEDFLAATERPRIGGLRRPRSGLRRDQ
jgi:hypothetical protein